MWILPKQLHTSDFVPDTAALNLDSNESSQLCAQSLFVRSKPSPVRTWLRKWKRDSWTRLLFGRILSPSHGQTFVERWTSSLADTHASHSAPPEIDSVKTTPGTSGRLSQTEFDFFNPESVSLKTSKDTSVLDSEKLSKNWKDLVTKRRGEYLARAKLGRPTKENGSSSWPTVTANEDSYRIGGSSQQSKCLSAMAKRGEMYGPVVVENPNYVGNPTGFWTIPKAGSLNPRWVETLMNVPLGWVMPSCSLSATTKWTSCGYLEMAYVRPRPSELFEC